MEELGPVTLEVHEGNGRLEQLLAEGFRLEASGWKDRRGTAIESGEDTRRFYEGMARWASAEGILRLSFLRIGGRAVAFDMGLESDGVHYALKGGYDPELRRLGPGRLLTEAMLERCFGLGLRRYEFLGGEDSYKLRWSDRRRELVTAQLYAPTLAGRVEQRVSSLVRSAGRRVVRTYRSATEDRLAAVGCLELLAGPLAGA